MSHILGVYKFCRDEIENHNTKSIESELGDVLFSIINASRLYGIDPEAALEKTNRKFIKRFNYLEKETLSILSISIATYSSIIFASCLTVSNKAKVDFPVRYPQISPGLMARVFPFFSMLLIFL